MGLFAKFKEAWLKPMSFDSLNEGFYDDLEEALILADVGMDTAVDAVAQLKKRAYAKLLTHEEDVKNALRDILAEKLSVGDPALDLSTRPSVALIIGVNGVGKTTSIGKLAHRLKNEGKAVNPHQLLFGINQGCTYADLRVEHMKQIADLDLDGYAIGGLAVGEPTDVMYEMIEVVNAILPEDRPRYLMGVGTPINILEGIARGVDMFDCVMPTRNGRNGQIFTSEGTINIRNKKWEDDFSPIDPEGTAFVDHVYTKAYLHHLTICQEMLGAQIASLHNIAFYLRLVTEARRHIGAGDFTPWKEQMVAKLGRRL